MEACPICGLAHAKRPNTPYCDDHKRIVDALLRQSKNNKRVKEKVAQIFKDKGDLWVRLVGRFEH
eukprot:10576604-Alexandrium_andersonii.AAC.1